MRIERALHEGVQQDLVALAVNLQLAGALVESDAAGAKQLVAEMARDVQQSLDETARLAQRIHPPLLERAASARRCERRPWASASERRSRSQRATTTRPSSCGRSTLCCARGSGTRRHGRPRDDPDPRRGSERSFSSVRAHPQAELDGLRDRFEALGGRLTIETEPEGGTRVSGSLPLAE